MGLFLSANCGACGYARAELKLGATHEQIAAHDVSTHELFRSTCCKAVVSVHVLHGANYPETACESCGEPLLLNADTRYRISTLKGEVYEGHACPDCGAGALSFAPSGKFL